MHPARHFVAPAAEDHESAAPILKPVEALDFARIYEAHVRFVWRTLRRLGVRDEDCEDAVQDVFLIVHRKLDEFRPEAPVKHWIFRIAAGIARDHRRSRRRKDPREHGLIPISVVENVEDQGLESPVDSAERSAAARLIRALLEEIDEARREVFILADLEQMTAPEIADVLKMPLNTVYSRLRRARSDFEDALARYRERERGTGAAALGAGAVAGSASQAGAATVGAFASTKILLLCGSIAVAGATVGALSVHRADPPARPAAGAAPRSDLGAAVQAPPAAPTAQEIPQATPGNENPIEPSLAAPPPPKLPSSDRPARARSIQAEFELIRAAQKHLHRNEPAEALALLTEHARRFPFGVLWEEREASRVFALCQKGDATAARALAERFVERSPASPFAERVRASCRSGTP